MELKVTTVSGIVLVVAVMSTALTKYYWPNVESKTQVVERQVIKTDVVTVVKEVTRVDGTKEIVTTTTDKTVKKEDTKATEVKIAIKSKYIFGGGIVSNFKDKPDYEISAGMRIIGPIFGQVKYQTNGSIGASLLIEF